MTIKTQRKYNRIPRLLVGVLLGTVAFLLSKNSFTEVMAQNEDLSQFLTYGDVEVLTEKGKGDFRQIKYKFKDAEFEVTDNDVTNAAPETSGEYIVWMSQIEGLWQIMLYYIPGEQTIQLTTSENNVNPSISGNNVVWEGQVNGVWQVFLFDGIRTKQLTVGSQPSQDSDVSGNSVVYSQKTSDGENWKVFLYDITTDTTTDLTSGAYGNGVTIENGVISWVQLDGLTYAQKTYSLVGEGSELPTAQPLEEIENMVIDSEESTEATNFVKENTPEEILEKLIEEDDDLPQQVTEEEIEEELGIQPSGEEENPIEEEIDSVLESTQPPSL